MKLKKFTIDPVTGKRNYYLSDTEGQKIRSANAFKMEETRFTDGNSDKYAQHYLQVNENIANVFQQSRSQHVLHTTSANVLHTLNNEMIPVKDGSYEHEIPVELSRAA